MTASLRTRAAQWRVRGSYAPPVVMQARTTRLPPGERMARIGQKARRLGARDAEAAASAGQEADARELRPCEALVAPSRPVADRIGRVLEEGRVVEAVDRPHREHLLDARDGDPRRAANGAVGRAHPAQPIDSPRDEAQEPWNDGHEREEEREHRRKPDHEIGEARA